MSSQTILRRAGSCTYDMPNALLRSTVCQSVITARMSGDGNPKRETPEMTVTVTRASEEIHVHPTHGILLIDKERVARNRRSLGRKKLGERKRTSARIATSTLRTTPLVEKSSVAAGLSAGWKHHEQLSASNALPHGSSSLHPVLSSQRGTAEPRVNANLPNNK